jgi:hypothetical protein
MEHVAEGLDTAVLDISSLPAGVYLLEVVSNLGVVLGRNKLKGLSR